MFDPDRFFRNSLADLKADGWYQTFLELERRAGAFPLTDCPGRSDPVVVWCSNDYLGMGQHPVVLAAMHEAVDRVGTGVGGTRNISGNTRDHVLLERELADLHGKEAALVFATGYVTNEAAVSTFAGLIPECIVYSDALHQEGVAYVKSRLRAHHCSRNRLGKVFISSCARKRGLEFCRCLWRSAVGFHGIRNARPEGSNELGGQRVPGCVVRG